MLGEMLSIRITGFLLYSEMEDVRQIAQLLINNFVAIGNNYGMTYVPNYVNAVKKKLCSDFEQKHVRLNTVYFIYKVR